MRSSLHLGVIRLNNIHRLHRSVFNDLRASGIGVQLLVPVHLTLLSRIWFQEGNFQKPRLMLPMQLTPLFPGLTLNSQIQDDKVLQEIL